MEKNVSILRTTQLALVAIGCVITGGPVVAQQISEIIVEAPYLRQQVGRTSSGSPIELITLTKRVGYADLNLALQADVEQLNKRINDTAEEACKQIKSLYPLDPSDPTCVKKAVDGGMAQAKVAIAAASGATSP